MKNLVILIGNLGQDPETFHFDNGTQQTKFPLATSESWKDSNGERQTVTDWHNIVCRNKVAEIASKYLKKGSKVYIEGKIKSRSYQQDNITKYVTEIFVNQLIMLDSKNS